MPLGGAPTTEDGSSCSCCVLGRSYDRATDVSLDRLTKPPRLYQSMTQKAFGASHDAAHVAFLLCILRWRDSHKRAGRHGRAHRKVIKCFLRSSRLSEYEEAMLIVQQCRQRDERERVCKHNIGVRHSLDSRIRLSVGRPPDSMPVCGDRGLSLAKDHYLKATAISRCLCYGGKDACHPCISLRRPVVRSAEPYRYSVR